MAIPRPLGPLSQLLAQLPATWDAIDETLIPLPPVFETLRLSSQANPFIVSSSSQTYAAYSGADESGPGVFIHRFVTTEASANEHGIVDATQFARAAKAYGSFDAQPVLTGTNNYDHYAGFQSRGDHASSGTLAGYYGF